MIRHYRRKPLLVTAVQWTGDNLMEVVAFINNKSIEEFKANLDEKEWSAYETLIKEHGQIVEISPNVSLLLNEYIIRGIDKELH